MDIKESSNAAYIPREDYLDGGGYLGYGSVRDEKGCLKMFFTIVAVIVCAIVGGLLAIIIK